MAIVRASALLLVIASLGVTSRSGAEAAVRKKVYADFGYVLVDPRDVSSAVDEGKAVQDAAKRVLELSAIRFAVVEEGSFGTSWGQMKNGYVVYPWPFPNGLRKRTSRPAIKVLRHEVGHDLFQRYFVPKSRIDQYGTDAPDWLDEMAAIAFEGPGEQAERRRNIRSGIAQGTLLPLSRLLSMVHPEFGPSSSLGKNAIIVTSSPTSGDTILFYLTIQAFYDFLRSQTGSDAIVVEIAAAFRRGDDLTMWIARRVGIDTGVGCLERLDDRFLQWLTADPRYTR
ncbi:hypothetical protein [uncultured Sphingomonas sp.]|uniref:hypothetical protein n=1 Tax=uncultured Sphingomonas sp. TaxID=158754 RepID=UPI003747B7FE